MITLHYSVTVQANAEKVWQVLWNNDTYRKWTTPFMEGSYAESHWEQGDEIRFLSPGNNGMFGVIEKKVPNKQMLFRHKGEIKNGELIPQDWDNATEGYELIETTAGTRLDVKVTMDDTHAEYAGFFEHTFPKALALVKELAEA